MTSVRSVAWHGLGLALASATIALAAACSGGDSAADAKADGAVGEAGDSSDGGGSSDAASDARRFDDGGPPAPADAKLLVGGDTFLVGVTSDGNAVYIASADGDGPLRMIPLAGGAPVVLAPSVHFEHVLVKGKAVAFWTDVIGNPLQGTFNVWTAAAGLKSNLGFTLANKAIFSEDGTRVAVPVNMRPLAEPPAMDLAVTDVASASVAAVITDMNLTDNGDYVPACTPQYTFVGRRLYVSHCTSVRQSTAILQSVSDTGAVTTVIDNAASPTSSTILASFSLDAAGEKAFVLGTDGTGRITTVATGESVTVDTNVRQGFIAPNGTYALYVKESPAPLPDFPNVFSLRRTPTAAPDTRLLADDIATVLAVNSDLSGVMFSVNEMSGDLRTNISFVDTTRDPATAVPLATMSAGRPIGFSGMGRHALYLTDLPGDGELIGKLKVYDSMAGAAVPPRVVSATAMAPVALSPGTKGLYCDNVRLAKAVGDRDYCDLMAFDMATTAAPTLLVGSADPFFFATSTQVAFVISTGASKGLYVKNVP